MNPPTDGPNATPSRTAEPIMPRARPALGGREHFTHDGGTQRGDEYRAQPLQRTACDQPSGRWREAAQQRAHGEDGQPGEVSPSLAVDVADARGSHDQCRRDQQIGEYHPLDRGERGAESGHERGQCDVHDAGIEREHEHAQAQPDQPEPALGRWLQCVCSRWCNGRSTQTASFKRPQTGADPAPADGCAMLSEGVCASNNQAARRRIAPGVSIIASMHAELNNAHARRMHQEEKKWFVF